MNVLKCFVFILLLTLINCTSPPSKSTHIVTTKVLIKPGEIDNVLQLFKESNPTLVKDQSDWIKAVFSKNEETSTVMVQAYWKNKESYLKFSASPQFQQTMQRFKPYFMGKPNVEINEILFEM